MTVLFYLLLATVLGSGLIWLFLSIPAARLARLATWSVPVVLIGLGGILTVLGRGAFGIPMAALGLAWLRRTRGMGRIFTSGRAQTSRVRSQMLEMELNHETGEMDGSILAGPWEGKTLSGLKEEELFVLLKEMRTDSESLALFETYLDRRIPAWREDAQAHAGTGERSAASSGAMTKEEAYQVLGLEPGASHAEIQAAWRKLMKGIHPDAGGSEFLAAKINMAKDILLD